MLIWYSKYHFKCKQKAFAFVSKIILAYTTSQDHKKDDYFELMLY